MLDHVFLAAVGALRGGLEDALLERHGVEERLQVDVLLGDVSWETSYTLPGEGVPPRVQAEVALDWPTWSQATYRSAVLGDPGDDPPELEMELVLRIQRLAAAPDAGRVLDTLPGEGPTVLGEALERNGPTVEQHCDAGDGAPQFAVEVSYAGVVPLPEEVLREVGRLDEHLAPVGRWVASALVRLADLDLAFLPPELEEGGLR